MKIAKKILVVAVALIVLLFVNNNYFKKIEPVIKADGAGYYDYLPSIFILKDFNRKNIAIHNDSVRFNRVLLSNFHVSYLNEKVNKYPVGTALLQSPFFFTSYFLAHLQYDAPTGFEMIFQKGIFYAAIFYLIIGLSFLFKLLRIYQVSKILSLISVLICLFGTNILYYTLIESSYSHVYSFTLITIFLYLVKVYSISFKKKYFYLAFLLLALIILTRQINILILCFVPFLFDNFNHFKTTLKTLVLNQKINLIVGIAILFSVVSLQFILWYFQTGHFTLYSYQNEHFNFLKPEFLDLLFSYKKGLFIYTPITFIIILSLIIYYIKNKDHYHLLTWLMPFFLISYVFSSWWSWFYGCSLGLRVYIDFYPVFFFPFGLMLQNSIKYIKLTTLALALFTVPYSLILTYQYKHFIIHWINMDKEMFWTTFLKYQNVYKGYIWLEKDTKNLTPLKKMYLGDQNFPPKTSSKIFIDTIPENSTINKIKLSLKSNYNPENASAFELKIYEAGQKEYFFKHYFYLYHFSDYKFPKNKDGEYLIKFDKPLPKSKLFLQLYFTSNEQRNLLSELEITYY